MHDQDSPKGTSDRTRAPQLPAAPPPPRARPRPAPSRPRQKRLEKLIAQAVAQQSELIATTIVERVVEEMTRRERAGATDQAADDDPIERMPLPTRVAKVMRRMGVRTIGQLTALREDDLAYLRNLGPSSIRQLKHILSLFGRRLAG